MLFMMMRYYFLCFWIIILTTPVCWSQKSQVWMIGPMLHFNFSEKKMHTSFGMELAWWNYEHFPYSFDGGIEIEKHKIRIYSEAQAGIGLIGISAGPVIEFRSDELKINIGIQESIWANYFGGFDLRFRAIGGKSCISPGIYFKLPLGYGGASETEHHHWDWDD